MAGQQDTAITVAVLHAPWFAYPGKEVEAQQQQQLRVMQQNLQAFVKDKVAERQQGLVCFFRFRTLLHVVVASSSAWHKRCGVQVT